MSLKESLITDDTVNLNHQSLFSIPEKDKGSLDRVVILSCSDGACFEPAYLWTKNRYLDYLVDIISKPGLVEKITEDNSRSREHLIQLCDLHSIRTVIFADHLECLKYPADPQVKNNNLSLVMNSVEQVIRESGLSPWRIKSQGRDKIREIIDFHGLMVKRVPPKKPLTIKKVNSLRIIFRYKTF